MAYLDEFPPRRPQSRPRREDPSGVAVVHTAENTPDFAAFDGGAESVAKFITARPDAGSYHDLADSDSCINLVGYDREAFHDGTGSNPHTYGVSVATRADVWPLAPQAWRDGAIRQAAAAAARYAGWLRARSGIVIPPRRITRAESEARLPGFISHAERDPGRRTDPGAAFPWNQFLGHFAALTTTPGDDDMSDAQFLTLMDRLNEIRPLLAFDPKAKAPVPYWLIFRASGTRTWVQDYSFLGRLTDGVEHNGLEAGPDGKLYPKPFAVSASELSHYGTVGKTPPA